VGKGGRRRLIGKPRKPKLFRAEHAVQSCSQQTEFAWFRL
jgi:hypothetical protein